MISLVHRTLFVHVPKCAGQSVEEAFCAELGMRWGKHRHLLGCMQKPRSWSSSFPGRLAHLTAHQYTSLDFLPEHLFNAFYKFAVVRDPIERVISTWRYLGVDQPFSEFVAETLPVRVAAGEFFVQSQRDYLYAPGTDRMLVDQVIPFSQIQEKWAEVQERAGIKTALGHRNRSNRSRPRPEVTSEDRARIEEIYAADYAAFTAF